MALRRAGLILFVGIGLTATIAVVGIVWAPEWWFLAAEPGTKGADLTAHRQAVRETAVRLATGVGAAVAGILAWGRLELSRQEHKGAERAQNTDRYTRAVEQLGHDSDDVVLGGLYALESLGKDSPSDRATITEVLSAFVREHGDADFAGEHDRQPSTVQAALTILGRTAWQPADLSGAILPRAKIFSADLTGVRFNAADLNGASLQAARMASARLMRTNLAGAHLTGACLVGATGVLTDMRRVHLLEADLTDASLTNAHLDGASLYKATLVGTNLSRTKLVKANLNHADLSRANLSGVDLTQATMRGANLEGADLNGANIEGAQMPKGWEDVVARRPDRTRPTRTDEQSGPPGPS